MATRSQRAMALVLALLFLATTVATGAIVIWQVREENKAKQAIETTLPDTSPTTLDTTNQQQEQTNMLKGTTLANFTPQGDVTELQKIDLTEGTGDAVQAGATVTVHYTGAYAVNGEIFESSKDSGQTATFPLSSVIKGWTDGVPGMKVGGTRRLIIPGDQAYGVAPEGYTPGSGGRPLGTLVFDIELISIN